MKASGNRARKPRLRGVARPFFLWIVPLLVVAVGLAIYFSQGRYVSTDNAYVKTSKADVTPEVSGHVKRVYVKENEPVTRGQLLLDVDAEPRVIALNRAKARLAATRTRIEALKAEYHLQEVRLQVARDQLKFARNEFERQRNLAARKLASTSEVDSAEQRYEALRGEALVAEQEMNELAAKLGGGPGIKTENHPEVIEARTDVADAALMLERTRLRAPRDGIVSHLPTVGDNLEVGVPALSIIADDGAWIEANFKETDLTRLYPGQTVEISIDSYPGHKWQGRVESIAQATGAEFALLPPQNASGNWVKIVQRIPVRIAIEKSADMPQLRRGMSAEVTVDIGGRDDASAVISSVE